MARPRWRPLLPLRRLLAGWIAGPGWQPDAAATPPPGPAGAPNHWLAHIRAVNPGVLLPGGMASAGGDQGQQPTPPPDPEGDALRPPPSQPSPESDTPRRERARPAPTADASRRERAQPAPPAATEAPDATPAPPAGPVLGPRRSPRPHRDTAPIVGTGRGRGRAQARRSTTRSARLLRPAVGALERLREALPLRGPGRPGGPPRQPSSAEPPDGRPGHSIVPGSPAAPARATHLTRVVYRCAPPARAAAPGPPPLPITVERARDRTGRLAAPPSGAERAWAVSAPARPDGAATSPETTAASAVDPSRTGWPPARPTAAAGEPAAPAGHPSPRWPALPPPREAPAGEDWRSAVALAAHLRFLDREQAGA